MNRFFLSLFLLLASPLYAADFEPGVLLVKLKPTTGLSSFKESQERDRLNTRYGLMSAVPVQVPTSSLYLYTFSPSADMVSLATQYQALDSIDYAQPNYYVYPDTVTCNLTAYKDILLLPTHSEVLVAVMETPSSRQAVIKKLNPKASLIPLFLSDHPTQLELALVFYDAVRLKAKLASCAWNGDVYTHILKEAIAYAQAKQVLIISPLHIEGVIHPSDSLGTHPMTGILSRLYSYKSELTSKEVKSLLETTSSDTPNIRAIYARMEVPQEDITPPPVEDTTPLWLKIIRFPLTLAEGFFSFFQ